MLYATKVAGNHVQVRSVFGFCNTLLLDRLVVCQPIILALELRYQTATELKEGQVLLIDDSGMVLSRNGFQLYDFDCLLFPKRLTCLLRIVTVYQRLFVVSYVVAVDAYGRYFCQIFARASAQ